MKTITSKKVMSLVFTTFFTCLFQLSSAQQVSSTLIESWGASDWTPTYQSVYVYDENEYLLTTTSQTWETATSVWENVVRVVNVNNPSGTVSQSTIQSWDGDTESWVDSQRTTNTYTAFDKVATSTSEIWAGVIWMAMSQTSYEYDGGQKLISETAQQWDFISSSWTNSSRILYVNNASGTVSQSTHQTWSAVTSSWTDANRHTYTYNASDKVLTVLSEAWDGAAWTNTDLETYNYDGSGYITSSLSQSWDTALSEWANSSQQLYTNNSDGSPYQIVSQQWEDGAWVNSLRITFTYSGLGIDDASRAVFSVYPIPASDYLTIGTSELLYSQPFTFSDLSGKQINNGVISGAETSVDVSGLSPGVYIIKIGNSRKAIKFIKN